MIEDDTDRLNILRRFIRNQATLTDAHPCKPGPGEVRLNHAEAIEVADFLDELARLQTWDLDRDG